MPISIRPALRADALVIVAVAAEVWPKEVLDVAAIGRLIAETDRVTLVAELDGAVVGFADGFTTRNASGSLRWEVDLLAVSSAAQGRGIGRRLVGESIAAGVVAGAVESRGLIRVGNIASERVFTASGFLPSLEESDLWVANGLVITARQSMHVVPVRTFRYSGAWLEEVNAEALRSLRPSTDGGVVGAVIPLADRASQIAAVAVGMAPAGLYRFWQRGS